MHTGNITTTGVICDATSCITVNETARFENLTAFDCQGGELVIGIESNGTVKCATDQQGGAASDDDSNYVNKTDAEDIGGIKKFTAMMNVSGIEPVSNDTYDLGNAEAYFQDIFVKTLNIINKITGSQILDATITKIKLAFSVYDVDQTYNKTEIDTNFTYYYNKSEVDTNFSNYLLIANFYDTNSTTECGDAEYLRGDGTCQEITTYTDDDSDYVNLTSPQSIDGAKNFTNNTVFESNLTITNGTSNMLFYHNGSNWIIDW